MWTWALELRTRTIEHHNHRTATSVLPRHAGARERKLAAFCGHAMPLVRYVALLASRVEPSGWSALAAETRLTSEMIAATSYPTWPAWVSPQIYSLSSASQSTHVRAIDLAFLLVMVILGLQLGDLDAHEQGRRRRKAESETEMWVDVDQEPTFQFEATELTLDRWRSSPLVSDPAPLPTEPRPKV